MEMLLKLIFHNSYSLIKLPHALNLAIPFALYHVPIEILPGSVLL